MIYCNLHCIYIYIAKSRMEHDHWPRFARSRSPLGNYHADRTRARWTECERKKENRRPTAYEDLRMVYGLVTNMVTSRERALRFFRWFRAEPTTKFYTQSNFKRSMLWIRNLGGGDQKEEWCKDRRRARWGGRRWKGWQRARSQDRWRERWWRGEE